MAQSTGWRRPRARCGRYSGARPSGIHRGSWWATGSGWSPSPPARSTAWSSVEPRTTLLERRVPEGSGTRPVAANIDEVFVVTATADPAPIPQLIDRLLVVAEANSIHAAVVVNKIELDPGPRR